MKWLTLALALLAAGALWWFDPAHIATRNAEAAAENALLAQDTALQLERSVVLAPWVTGLQIVGIICLAVLAGGATVAALAWLYRRGTTVMPTHDGRLPVPLTQLPAASVAALGATHARLQLATTEQPLTAALTFDAELYQLLDAPLD